jgi:formylglycine-generating enzyme required for sulfatase activity
VLLQTGGHDGFELYRPHSPPAAERFVRSIVTPESAWRFKNDWSRQEHAMLCYRSWGCSLALLLTVGLAPGLLLADPPSGKNPPLARAPFDSQKAKDLQQAWASHLARKTEVAVDLGGGVRMQFILIPPGTYMMGSPENEEGRVNDEAPHAVTITKPFFLGKYAVTRGQFRRFAVAAKYQTEAEKDGLGGWGYDEPNDRFEGPTWNAKTGAYAGGAKTRYNWANTGFRQTDDHPVVNVSWNDAKAFCRWLAASSGRSVRLPTEAEREYACRAGSQTRYHFGDNAEDLAKYANMADGTRKKRFPRFTTIAAQDGYVFTAPVGRFLPNGFGLFDMHGNVWQWCEDWYGPYKGLPAQDPLRLQKTVLHCRVVRGGSWSGQTRHCRSADRRGLVPVNRQHTVGFRVAFGLD